MNTPQIIITVFCGIAMVIGLIGIVIPFIPGIILMWVGYILFAGLTEFEIVSLNSVYVVSGLTLAAFILEFFSRHWGNNKLRASRWGLLGAVIGGTIGFAFDWLPAILIGSFIGAVIGEVYSGRDEVFKIHFKTFSLIGFVGSTIVKITIGVVIISLFVTRLLEYYK